MLHVCGDAQTFAKLYICMYDASMQLAKLQTGWQHKTSLLVSPRTTIPCVRHAGSTSSITTHLLPCALGGTEPCDRGRTRFLTDTSCCSFPFCEQIQMSRRRCVGLSFSILSYSREMISYYFPFDQRSSPRHA